MSSLASFFNASRHYIVVGASSNPNKYGYKVLDWYINHKLPVTPVNPGGDSILGVKTVPSIFAILDAVKENKNVANIKIAVDIEGFSVSFITPPTVTLDIINRLITEKYNEDGLLKGFWFQPGSFDDEVIKRARELNLGTIIDDHCILVSGGYGLSQSRL